MKLLIQRVNSASVVVESDTVARINQGILVFAGFGHHDSENLLVKAVEKLMHLRVFADEAGRFQYSVLEQNKAILAVPQFTLYGTTQSGRRPEFTAAMKPDQAQHLFDRFCQLLRESQLETVAFGVFGAQMEVSLVNDGPVTLMIEL